MFLHLLPQQFLLHQDYLRPQSFHSRHLHYHHQQLHYLHFLYFPDLFGGIRFQNLLHLLYQDYPKYQFLLWQHCQDFLHRLDLEQLLLEVVLEQSSFRGH
jgi:hypothetical protein